MRDENTPRRWIDVGQAVHRADRVGVGIVVGLLLIPVVRAIVRWSDGMSFERLDDLVEVGDSDPGTPAEPLPGGDDSGSAT